MVETRVKQEFFKWPVWGNLYYMATIVQLGLTNGGSRPDPLSCLCLCRQCDRSTIMRIRAHSQLLRFLFNGTLNYCDRGCLAAKPEVFTNSSWQKKFAATDLTRNFYADNCAQFRLSQRYFEICSCQSNYFGFWWLSSNHKLLWSDRVIQDIFSLTPIQWKMSFIPFLTDAHFGFAWITLLKGIRAPPGAVCCMDGQRH